MSTSALLGSQEHGRETRDYHGFESRLLAEERYSGVVSAPVLGIGGEAGGRRVVFLSYPRRLFESGREAEVLRSSYGVPVSSYLSVSTEPPP